MKIKTITFVLLFSLYSISRISAFVTYTYKYHFDVPHNANSVFVLCEEDNLIQNGYAFLSQWSNAIGACNPYNIDNTMVHLMDMAFYNNIVVQYGNGQIYTVPATNDGVPDRISSLKNLYNPNASQYPFYTSRFCGAVLMNGGDATNDWDEFDVTSNYAFIDLSLLGDVDEPNCTIGTRPSIDVTSLMLHELCHGMGLYHVPDDHKLMSETMDQCKVRDFLTSDEINGFKCIFNIPWGQTCNGTIVTPINTVVSNSSIEVPVLIQNKQLHWSCDDENAIGFNVCVETKNHVMKTINNSFIKSAAGANKYVFDLQKNHASKIVLEAIYENGVHKFIKVN